MKVLPTILSHRTQKVNHQKFVVILLVWLGVGFLFPVQAQLFPNLGGQRVGIAGMPFLKNDLSPKSVAMGGANVSLNGDIYAPSNNIALSAEVLTPTVGISNLAFGGLNHNFASVIIPYKTYGTWTVSVHNLSAGEMDVRTEFSPQGTGAKFSTTNMAAGIGYAKQLSDMFSFGVFAKYMYESVAEYNASALAADIGFLYKTDWKHLRFAATLQNFGTNSTYNGSAVREPFNRNNQVAESYPAPITFKLGASLDLLDQDKHKIVAAAQLYHPSDNTENVRIGFEYSFNNMFFGRGGYRFNVPNETLPSFGVGIVHEVVQVPLAIDFGVQPSNNLGMIWSAGLSIGMHQKKVDQTVGNQ